MLRMAMCCHDTHNTKQHQFTDNRTHVWFHDSFLSFHSQYSTNLRFLFNIWFNQWSRHAFISIDLMWNLFNLYYSSFVYRCKSVSPSTFIYFLTCQPFPYEKWLLLHWNKSTLLSSNNDWLNDVRQPIFNKNFYPEFFCPICSRQNITHNVRSFRVQEFQFHSNDTLNELTSNWRKPLQDLIPIWVKWNGLKCLNQKYVYQLFNGSQITSDVRNRLPFFHINRAAKSGLKSDFSHPY